jgi:hypothetical protein
MVTATAKYLQAERFVTFRYRRMITGKDGPQLSQTMTTFWLYDTSRQGLADDLVTARSYKKNGAEAPSCNCHLC